MSGIFLASKLNLSVFQYWPELEGTSLTCGIYEIHSDSIENYEDFIVTSLTITNTR